MLARLGSIAGVGSADVDHRGELLRLRLDRADALASVRAALEELGYGAADVTDDPASAGEARWYGAQTVRQLSREESEVIARRITPPITDASSRDPAASDRLTSVVADALYGCFIAHTLVAGTPPGAMREACATAVEAAATPLIGAAGARQLAAVLRQDLLSIEETEG